MSMGAVYGLLALVCGNFCWAIFSSIIPVSWKNRFKRKRKALKWWAGLCGVLLLAVVMSILQEHEKEKENFSMAHNFESALSTTVTTGNSVLVAKLAVLQKAVDQCNKYNRNSQAQKADKVVEPHNPYPVVSE